MTTTAEETNCVIYVADNLAEGSRHYAACQAQGCTWVGPTRVTPAAAKRDAVKHHLSD